MLIALDILRKLEEYNRGIEDETRKFQVRIGLNANTDNLVTDINGKLNIAGRGINMAQRIMAMTDGNQIMIGESVFEILHVRETYMKFFRPFPPIPVKHELIRMYQFIDESKCGLDTSIPELLKPKEQKADEPKLSFWAACYFAQAIKHRAFLIQEKDLFTNEKLIFLWMLARDTVSEIESKGLTSYPQLSYKAGKVEPLEQIKFYSELDLGVSHGLADFKERYLDKYPYTLLEDFNRYVVAQAIPELKEDAKPDEIDNDWMARFFEASKLVSDKEMQSLWGRLLAGEANKAGTFTKRTIDQVSNLEKRDAQLFTNLCAFVWRIRDLVPLVVDFIGDDIYEAQMINVATLRHLDDIGLISFNVVGSLSEDDMPQVQTFLYHGMSFSLEFPKPDNNKLEIGHVLLTQAGQELAPISGSIANIQFLESVVKTWIQRGIKVWSPLPDTKAKQ